MYEHKWTFSSIFLFEHHLALVLIVVQLVTNMGELRRFPFRDLSSSLMLAASVSARAATGVRIYSRAAKAPSPPPPPSGRHFALPKDEIKTYVEK